MLYSALMEFGERLKQSRKRRGWKQADLAKRLGVSVQAVSNWERGQNDPEYARVVEIFRLLGEDIPGVPADSTKPDETSLERIGQRLAQVRRALGLEAINLAAKLDIPSGLWDSYEAGISLIEHRHIYKLMNLMPGLTSDWVLFGDRNNLSVAASERLDSAA